MILKSVASIVKIIKVLGRVAVHFEFYILKCMTFWNVKKILIGFLDELDNFKQEKISTFQNVKLL